LFAIIFVGVTDIVLGADKLHGLAGGVAVVAGASCVLVAVGGTKLSSWEAVPLCQCKKSREDQKKGDGHLHAENDNISDSI
jgi:hypothetical protein